MSKMNTTYVVPVLVLALLFSAVPQIGSSLQLWANPVASWWDDLLGRSSETETKVSPTVSNHMIFIKFEGVDGESKDDDHYKWIDVESVQWGVRQPEGAIGASRRRGDVIVEDITITKELDKSSPKLQEKCLKGQVIPKLEIEVTSTYGGYRATYYRYELKNVIITSYNVESGSGEDRPTDTFTVNYEEIKNTYTEYDEEGSSKGNVEWEFKLVTNEE